MDTSLRITPIDDSLSIGTWRNCAFVLFKGALRAESLRAMQKSILEFGGTRGRNTLLLSIAGSAEPPSAEARSAMVESLKSFGPIVAASALVFEGKGFTAATLRTAVSVMTSLASPPFPHKVFGTVADAAKWLAGNQPKEGGPIAPEALVESVTQARQKVGVLPPAQ